MLTIKRAILLFLSASMPPLVFAGEIVDSSAALVAAVRDGAEGATIDGSPPNRVARPLYGNGTWSSRDGIKSRSKPK